MDGMRQLGKEINKMGDTASFASKRHQRFKKVERATDTFDRIIPFSMDFKASDKDVVNLSLGFKQPAPSLCCGSCYCSVCEDFSGNITVTLTYGYISGTLNVFVNKVQVFDFEELDPAAGTLKLNTTGDAIRICYIYYVNGCIPSVTGGGGCVEVPFFDNFTRSLSDDAGTSDDGHTWSWSSDVIGLSSSGVNGSALYLDMFGDRETFISVNSPGPWDGDFTMTARCRANPVPVSTGIPGPTNSEKVTFDFFLNSDASNGQDVIVDVSSATISSAGANRAQFYIDDDLNGSGQTQQSDVAVDSNTTFTNNGWFFIEWLRRNGTAELRIWQDAQSRPAALLSVPFGPSTVTGFNVDISGFNIRNSIQVPPDGEEIYMEIDYIKFEVC